jgi:TPR repeat protein
MSTAASNGNTLTVRPTPFLHNHLSQPDANLPMHGAIDMAPGQLPSATSDALTQGPRAPVVTTRDDSKASSFEAIPRAAILQNANAHYDLGLKYKTGRGVEPNDEEAVKYFQVAADQGHVTAQCKLGFMYLTGDGVERNYKEAVKYFQLAVVQGHATAQCNLGFMYQNGRGVAQSEANAIKYYRLSADQGNATAQCNLGFMYQNGRGIAQSEANAIKYYRLSADQGCARAQYRLAAMDLFRFTSLQNFEEAYESYHLAEQGDVGAQYWLARLFRCKAGSEIQYTHAANYYGLAARQGHSCAQEELAWMYSHGEGVAQNFTKAAKYFGLAAAQANKDAQFGLGTLYRDGKGVPRDAEKAMRSFWMSMRETNVINLSGLKITDNMLKYLPNLFEEFGGYGQMKDCSPATEIDLSCNRITDNGAQFIALILKHTKTLTKLDLRNTDITDHGMKLILDALKNYNTSVVECRVSPASTATKKALNELIEQNCAIEKIMDGMDTHYPMDIPKAFDVLPMDVLRQLLPAIAVAHAKIPAPSNLSTTISSMLGHKPATTKQAMDEVYTALMIDPASAGLKEKQGKNKPNSHLIHFVR